LESLEGSYFHDEKSSTNKIATEDFIIRGLKKTIDPVMVVDRVDMPLIDRADAMTQVMEHMIDIFSYETSTRTKLKFVHGSPGCGKTRLINSILQIYLNWYMNGCAGDIDLNISDTNSAAVTSSSSSNTSSYPPLIQQYLRSMIPVALTFNS